ncbi:MAG: ACP S-malonyltransferase [Alphaproteobacteria bacterium]|nr:ACP S-malonyltransferase [Alphaproteobacteria bacterium]
MKYAFIFPGQGSQHIGMGKELYENFDAAKRVFDEVDEALKQNLYALMSDGSQAELTLTVNAQPAIMAVCMAVIRVLEKEFCIDLKDKVSFVAGHSLGEYAAACTAGVFDITTTAKLLRLRGEAMQQAVPVGVGGMLAVLGLSFGEVDALIEAASDENYFCVAANDNTEGQVVLSGHLKALQKAAEIASEFGAKKAIMLPVSAPFHSPLMAPAVNIMNKALQSAPSFEPKIALISNVTATAALSKTEIISNLEKQITGMVRFRETMLYLCAQNVTDIIEIGPGSVLSNMVKRSHKDIYTTSVETPSAIEELAGNL